MPTMEASTKKSIREIYDGFSDVAKRNTKSAFLKKYKASEMTFYRYLNTTPPDFQKWINDYWDEQELVER
jgi:hypothetical protein